MDESDLGEPPAATAAIDDVIKYLKGVSLLIFEENNPCHALDRVNAYILFSSCHFYGKSKMLQISNFYCTC